MAELKSGNTFSLFALLDPIRRRKWLVIIPAILLGGGFSYYAAQQPDRYRATTQLAAQQLTPPEYLKQVAPAPVRIQDYLWTVREVLFSEPVLTETARELGAYRGAPSGLTQQALEDIKTSISIKVEGDRTFSVTFEGAKAEEVARAANKLSQLFVAQASTNQERKTEDAQGIIAAQLRELKERLAQEDKQVREYKQSAAHELPEHVDDSIRALDGLKAAYQETQSKIADDDARRTSIVRQLRELEEKGALEEPVAPETPAEARLSVLRIAFEEMRHRYKPGYPDIVRAQREIADLEQAIALKPKQARGEPSATHLQYISLQSEHEGIEQRLDSYRQELESITGQIAEYQNRIEAAPRHERALDAMSREMTVGESQLRALLDKQLDTKLAEGFQNSKTGVAFTIVEPASVPQQPFSPRRERFVLLGIVAGLGLGILLAFLVEQNDTSFGSVDDLQQFTTFPVAGEIPHIEVKGNAIERARNAIVTLHHPESVAAEQYRILAMKVQQQCLQNGSCIMMITSAAGGEGKSLTAINLGTALTSVVDGPVLLIDADMRRPSLHGYLGLPGPRSKGFQRLVANVDDDYNDYIVKLRELSIIPGSPPTGGNPLAVPAQARIAALFAQFRQRFKAIIIDAPPTLTIADSHILGGFCDVVFFVVRARKTPRELFQHAAESFDPSNLKGMVLNDVDYRRSRYAWAYKYYRENYLAGKATG